MIVPLIGFNKTNHRLGYGFNYYNDFLHWYNRIRTIGIAYNFQNNDEFTVSRYDKILNKIITDET
jgi:5-formyltetrahydrofolate cyclo-ligase